MTTIGERREKYSKEVEPRPYSRFTSNPLEIQANADWARKADKDECGYYCTCNKGGNNY